MPLGPGDARPGAAPPPDPLPGVRPARDADRPQRRGIPCAGRAARSRSSRRHPLPTAGAGSARLRLRGRALRPDDAHAGLKRRNDMRKAEAMSKSDAASERAAGSFDVKVTPQKPDTQIARAANIGRLTIDKRFHGDLEGISKGEMLATQSDVK